MVTPPGNPMVGVEGKIKDFYFTSNGLYGLY